MKRATHSTRDSSKKAILSREYVFNRIRRFRRGFYFDLDHLYVKHDADPEDSVIAKTPENIHGAFQLLTAILAPRKTLQASVFSSEYPLGVNRLRIAVELDAFGLSSLLKLIQTVSIEAIDISRMTCQTDIWKQLTAWLNDTKYPLYIDGIDTAQIEGDSPENLLNLREMAKKVCKKNLIESALKELCDGTKAEYHFSFIVSEDVIGYMRNNRTCTSKISFNKTPRPVDCDLEESNKDYDREVNQYSARNWICAKSRNGLFILNGEIDSPHSYSILLSALSLTDHLCGLEIALVRNQFSFKDIQNNRKLNYIHLIGDNNYSHSRDDSSCLEDAITAVENGLPLRTLRLDCISLRDSAVRRLATFLKTDRTLAVLEVNNPRASSGVSVEAMTFLAKGLTTNKTLVRLCLHHQSQMDDVELGNFLQILKPNTALLGLELEQDPGLGQLSYRPDNWKEIKQKCDRRAQKIKRALSENVARSAEICNGAGVPTEAEASKKLQESINAGASPYARDSNGQFAFITALKTGHEKVIRMLLRQGVFPHLVFKEEGVLCTPFNIPEVLKNETLKQLLLEPPPLLKPKEHGIKAYCSASSPPSTVGQFPLKRPADQQLSPTAIKVSRSATDVPMSVMPASISAENVPSLAQEPSMSAAFLVMSLARQQLYMKVMGRQLTERDLTPEITVTLFPGGLTMLHLACISRDANLVAALLNAGASADAVDIFGRTPLWYVCKPPYIGEENKKIVELLLARKVSANPTDALGRSLMADIVVGFAPWDCNADQHPELIVITRLLLAHRANSAETVEELPYDEPSVPGMMRNATALLIACARGNYKLVKTMVLSELYRSNAQNAAGDSVLHIAARIGNAKMISCVLLDAHLTHRDLQTKNLAGISPQEEMDRRRQAEHENVDVQTAYRLVEQFLKHRLAPSGGGVIWSQSLCFWYGKQPEHPAVIDVTDVHARLRTASEKLKTDQQTTEFFNPKKKISPIDTTKAAITFVMSDGRYTKNSGIKPVTVYFDELVDTSEEQSSIHISQYYARRSFEMQRVIQSRVRALPTSVSAQLAADSYAQPMNAEAVEDLFQGKNASEGTKTVEQRFHHAEQAVLAALSDPVFQDMLIAQLKKTAGFSEGSKLYALIINVHCPHYVCGDCQASLIGEVHREEGFLRTLQIKLEGASCSISKGMHHMRTLTCVSSKIPPRERVKTNVDQHGSYHIDLRADCRRLIVQQDVETMAPKGGIRFAAHRQ